jgi:putative endonuclease
MSNANRTLYTGMTNDLIRRPQQHIDGYYDNAFTKRYNFDLLVYFEPAASKSEAAKREKQIKGWTRTKKIALIESKNPDWKDLSVSWRDVLG